MTPAIYLLGIYWVSTMRVITITGCALASAQLRSCWTEVHVTVSRGDPYWSLDSNDPGVAVCTEAER